MKKTAKLWFALLFAMIFFVSLISSQEQAQISSCDEMRIRELIPSLDRTNMLRIVLESGDRGNGKPEKWIDGMQGSFVRQASFTVEYVMSSDKPSIKLESVDYYYGYFDYDTQVTEATRKRIHDSGLEEESAKASFNRAAVQSEKIISNFRKLYPKLASSKKAFCGKIFVNLLDDAKLPALERVPTIETECRKK